MKLELPSLVKFDICFISAISLLTVILGVLHYFLYNG